MSPVRFVVPGNWGALTGRDMSNLWTEADTLGDALRWLTSEFPAVADRILTAEGTIPRYAAVALNDERVSAAEGIDIPLTGQQPHEVCVLSAFMGG
ncbi:MoaD/ThiS family protein [Nocardia alni]|uniref:MoaD/ThiS family protein n=1 Tax=Nocardia alni TaxID=2815723 RepID=UPI001C231C26|nr:MoaD/ThiS family protein [Nocardia alni]